MWKFAVLVLAFPIVLPACGKPKNDPEQPGMPSAENVAKKAKYEELAVEVEDDDGAVEQDTCDGAHWTYLRCAAGRPIRARAFMDGDRRLHRRTGAYPECYPNESASSDSQDLRLYALACSIRTKDVQFAQDIFSQAKENGWRTGDGPISRTVMRPNEQGLFARAIKKMGGTEFGETILPNPQPATQTDFEAQLQVVSILVDGCTQGAITDEQKDRLKDQVARQPLNALFSAALARYDASYAPKANELLANPIWWPVDRLPTSADHCENWLTQRDDGADWQPCPDQGRKHDGGDFLFAMSVLDGSFCTL